MQMAHPLVAAGVHDHSSFRSGPLGTMVRLRRTIDAMLALTFGGEAEADEAARGILAIHDRVHGRLSSAVGPFRAGTPYSAHDPELLLWVHATLMDSILSAYEMLVTALNPNERDEYVAAAALGMARLGLPLERTPRTAAALHAFIETVIASGRLAVSRDSRDLAAAVLEPAGGWMFLPFVRIQRLIAIGTLPRSIREMYGFPWAAARQRRLELAVTAIRRARASAPDVLVRWAAARTGKGTHGAGS
jgi:uncharacterized protein (DUF2236 family)